MTYFHTGIRTIIGAKSFHCPVRDGKEWDQLAMVVRQKLFVTLTQGSRQPIYRANQLHRMNEPVFNCMNAGFLNASTWHNFLETLYVNQSYRVKPHEQLVSVS